MVKRGGSDFAQSNIDSGPVPRRKRYIERSADNAEDLFSSTNKRFVFFFSLSLLIVSSTEIQAFFLFLSSHPHFSGLSVLFELNFFVLCALIEYRVGSSYTSGRTSI